MASLREQILARIATVLAATPPGGAAVFRSRETGITRVQTPAIAVLMGGETDTRASAGADKHVLRVNLAIFVRGDPWDNLVDAVATPMHALVMNDAGLQALALDIRKTSSEPESQEADLTAGVLSCMYEITYLTRAGDIAAAPI